MTDTKSFEGTITVCGGAAKPSDEHLLSIVHCEDEEIISWLPRREQLREARRSIKPNHTTTKN
jgi:hypothetical protein